jgi:hypothetical protein
MFPEDDIPWNADTLMQLVANVRGLYAQKKLMIGFDAEPTVVVYHKTGKTSERLLDNNYPYHLNVCGSDVVWIVKATVETTICCW